MSYRHGYYFNNNHIFLFFSFHIFKTTTHKIYQKNFKGFERALTLVLMTLQQNRNLRFRFILLFLLFLWSFQFLFIRFDLNFIEVIQKKFQLHLNYSSDSPILFSCPEICFYAILFLSWKQYNHSECASKFWISMACEISLLLLDNVGSKMDRWFVFVCLYCKQMFIVSYNAW